MFQHDHQKRLALHKFSLAKCGIPATSAATPNEPPKPSFNLLTLPSEIRNQIYELVFRNALCQKCGGTWHECSCSNPESPASTPSPNVPTSLEKEKVQGIPIATLTKNLPAISRSCWTVLRETLPMLLASKTFKLRCERHPRLAAATVLSVRTELWLQKLSDSVQIRRLEISCITGAEESLAPKATAQVGELKRWVKVPLTCKIDVPIRSRENPDCTPVVSMEYGVEVCDVGFNERLGRMLAALTRYLGEQLKSSETGALGLEEMEGVRKILERGGCVWVPGRLSNLHGLEPWYDHGDE